MTISDLEKLLNEAQKKATEKQNAIDGGAAQRAADLAWHESLSGHFQKVNQAYCAPDDIISAICEAETATTTLVTETRLLLEDLKNDDPETNERGAIAQALRAYNKMEHAATYMESIECGMEKISDGSFNSSEIKLKLDTVFTSLTAIRLKSQDALLAMLLTVKQVSGLEHAITCDRGLGKQFNELQSLAACAKETTRDFWASTDSEFDAAKAKKKEWDTLFAKKQMYVSLVTTYENALAAMRAA